MNSLYFIIFSSIFLTFININIAGRTVDIRSVDSGNSNRSNESSTDPGLDNTTETQFTSTSDNEGEERDVSPTTESEDITRDMIWDAVRGVEDDPYQSGSGLKSNSTQDVVVMPGLPGLPGMPGLPGQAELQTSMSRTNPEFSNCRFNVSGDGRFVCNYTDTDGVQVSVPRAIEGSAIHPFKKFFRNSYPLRRTNGMFNINDRHHNRNHHRELAAFNTNNGFSKASQTNLTSNNSSQFNFGNHSANLRPTFVVHEQIRKPSALFHENLSLITASKYESSQEPANTLNNSTSSIRLPVGPGFRQVLYEALVMNLEQTNYDLSNWYPFNNPRGIGANSFGAIGIPGRPGMPGQPGATIVANGPPENDIYQLELAQPLTSNRVPVTTITHGNPTVIRTQPGYPNLDPIPPSSRQFGIPGVVPGIPGVQSSANYYGNRPGSVVSSQASTGIGSQPPFNPGGPIIAQPGYPGYTPYPPGYGGYPPGYPIGQPISNPLYPGIPNTLGYQFY